MQYILQRSYLQKLVVIVECGCGHCDGLAAEYWTRDRQGAGSTLARCSNPQQVANLLCAQDNSASYPQRDGK